MKVRKWILKWYVLGSIGLVINLIIAATWVPQLEVKAEENTLPPNHPSVRYYIGKPPEITEDLLLLSVELDDGSKFSISVKEMRALREVVRVLLEERIAALGAELFAARGGTTVGTVHAKHELRLLEALVAKLSELRDTLSGREDQVK